MELMPHIKALLDDLIKMTKHIEVKRTDLANQYEDNTRTLLLYQQVSEINQGMSSFYTYNVYPKEVLNSYGKWVKTENISEFGVLNPLLKDEKGNIKDTIGSMLFGSKMTISNNNPTKDTKRTKIGDGWVKLLHDGYFYKFKEYEATTKHYSYNISKPDKNGDYDQNNIIPSFIFNGNLYNSKNISLYIKDVRYDKYVKINPIFISEYIKDIDNTTLINYALNYDILYEVGTRFAYNNVDHDKFKKDIKDLSNKHISLSTSLNGISVRLNHLNFYF